MKKYISLLLAISMLSPLSAIAQSTPEPAVTEAPTATEAPAVTETPESIAVDPTEEPAQAITATAAPTAAPRPSEVPSVTSDVVTVDLVVGDHQVELNASAHFNLFNSKGELVSTTAYWVGMGMDLVQLSFSVPEYAAGEAFTFGFVDGFTSLTYNNETIKPGQWFELTTGTATDEAGNTVCANHFVIDAEPCFERGLNFYYNNSLIELSPRGRLVDGIGMMPAESIGKAMGVSVAYHEKYNSLTMSLGTEQLIFNVDNVYSTFFGEDINISHAPVWIDGAVYVPIRDVLNAFGCTIDLWQDADHIDVISNESPKIAEYRSKERVNQEGITSRTKYLIWVSKSDFTVKVYEGEQYNWNCIRTAPCAIGAPGTPTIEGQFEYKYAGGKWDYGSYYVWPTMMFYGGYALHSTLRSIYGGEYDGRVGVMISHGCVRMHPEDIEWIYALIPVGTRIYVTP